MRKGEGHNGEEVYDYVLVYTDDILIISIDGKEIMNQLDQHCMVKKDSIGFPNIYLGAQVSVYQSTWMMKTLTTTNKKTGC